VLQSHKLQNPPQLLYHFLEMIAIDTLLKTTKLSLLEQAHILIYFREQNVYRNRTGNRQRALH
jgi:hypothetical protein